MDEPRYYYTKLSQKEKDKYHKASLIYEIYNMTQMNSFTKQKQIHRHRKKSLDYQRGGGKGQVYWDTGIETKSYCIFTNLQ